MYTPPMFKTDRAASLAFAQARGFGTVCGWDGSRPIASSLPFYLTYADDGTPLAAFHLSRHNPLLALADGASSWLIAVNGADAYVSPDWYASPDQVPTWLYQAVHFTGTVRKMTAGGLDAMKKAIVGLLMSVDEVEGSFKLNQHKSDADYAGVANALAQQPQTAGRAVSEEMRMLRPQLFASQTTQLNVNAMAEGTVR